MKAVKRVFLAVLGLILCAAAVYGYSATRRERDYRQLIVRGEAALARDDTFAASEAFTGAIAIKGDSMLGYLKRGETYRRRDEFDAAVRDLRRAAELDPLAPRPLELLGDVHYALATKLEADRSFDQSLAGFDRAAERYQAYIELDDRSPRVLYKLALAHYSAGRPVSAVTALQRAVAIDDRFAEAYYLLGLCFRDLQNRDDSLRALETSVRIAPAMLYAREELADLYGRLGRGDDRIAQLEALLALDPGPSRQVTLGMAYARAGQFDRAVTTLGQAAERYPDHPYTYVALGRVWLEKAQPRPDRVDLSKALGALQGAVTGTDDSSEALTLLGRALLLAQDEEVAERVLQQATEKLPADPLAFYHLADAADRRGHPDVARRALLDYLALQGEDPDARRRATLAIRIADFSMTLGDGASAATWYQRAIDATGADAPVLLRLAEAQIKAGTPDIARATVAKALEKDPASRAARTLQRRLR